MMTEASIGRPERPRPPQKQAHPHCAQQDQQGLRHPAKQMSYDDEPLSAFFTASSAAWNPMRLCVPSQKGLLTDPPQRQSENAVLPVRSYGVPFTSTNSMDPSGASTRNGPLGLTVIFTCAINAILQPYGFLVGIKDITKRGRVSRLQIFTQRGSEQTLGPLWVAVVGSKR